MNMLPWKKRALAVVVALAVSSPVLAQSGADFEARLRKLEAEVAALQRQVFPGGDPRYFPQIQPGQPTTSAPGTPATTPGADMLARMDALEAQLARLTAQLEEQQNQIDKMNARIETLEAAAKAETPAGPPPATGTSTQTNLSAMNGTAAPAPTPPAPKPAPAPAPTVTKGSAAKPAASADPSAKRVAAVKAVEKPKTNDPGEDEYTYGFRLFDAKFYPESQQQLKLFLQKYPKHKRTSYARNLLGRAYLEDGNAREAAGWFLQNYKLEPKGDRAPDSLLYLAEAMRQLDDSERACVALETFSREYPVEAAGRLKAQFTATRGKVKCN